MKTVELQSDEGFVDERCARCGHDVLNHFRTFGASQIGPDYRCPACPTERRCEGFVPRMRPLREREQAHRLVWLFEIDGMKARCVAAGDKGFLLQTKHLNTAGGWEDLRERADPVELLEYLTELPAIAGVIRGR
jgi:DNA-directed RNA polymerase subunit RPC12/RpoP